MRYFYDLGNGQRLEFGNDGSQTYIGFSTSSPGQSQGQGNSFDTGEWSEKPSLHGLGSGLVLEVHTNNGSRFFRVEGNHVRPVDNPDIRNAKSLSFQEASGDSGFKPMKSMEPMKPMKPMEPMKPMRPMGS